MQVPRICPPGFVCEVSGSQIADNPCPAGHFCLEGTATSATTCGNPDLSSDLFPIMSHGERPSTLRKNRIAQGQKLFLGARNSGCWTNSSDDYGLQGSSQPSLFWMERHLLPLAVDSPFVPLRGRYCLDDLCVKLADADNYEASDYAFDYSASTFRLRRPVPCPAGRYCHPGTAVDFSNAKNFTTPQPCYESMYCPEGSEQPTGSGECPAGYYCPFGVKLACPTGTYCPRDGHWDPFPCPPGTFSAQLAIAKCPKCPRGFICPGFGRVAPTLCPPGSVCSKEGLRSPNFLCPAGFYCPSGTETVDPFRNDTTLRPYACSPGTYCLTGVGFKEVKAGDFKYAQPCTEGFYCESASNNPRGAGLCPIGFVCPQGTSAPRPAKKGFSAELRGTILEAECLPGTYAPTVESVVCYPCPPGTSCEAAGMAIASVCPPGSYRSTIAEDGIPCVACPQGYWSKNYGLREKGECVKCATGTFCPVDGMTTPCSHSDLPSSFEPIINYNGLPNLEYLFPSFIKKIYYSYLACLQLNDGYIAGQMDPFNQLYFFGELVPPYIDVLGRGPNFRATDQFHLKYQTTAKCYRNTQRYGSPLYQRMTEYYGPMYDIQNNGSHHQGYSLLKADGSAYYSGFFGHGSLFIDLPRARKFEPSYNCTKGFRLMNETRIAYDSNSVTLTVYTDATTDPAKVSRQIFMGEDQLYPGTCEADLICYSAVALDASSEGQYCTEGYICDERTTSTESLLYLCRAGYACDKGSTPDPSLEATMGQFRTLCPAGYQCVDGTSRADAYRTFCPKNYFCPTGTGDPQIGIMANDAVNRNLTDIDPGTNPMHVQYQSKDSVFVDSDQGFLCKEGIDPDLEMRYDLEWLAVGEGLNNQYLQYLRDQVDGRLPYQNDPFLTKKSDHEYYRPKPVNLAAKSRQRCARDGKWSLVADAIDRRECNCEDFFKVVIALYRLWKCTDSGVLDSIGLGSIVGPFSSSANRDYWFPRIPRGVNDRQCNFSSIPYNWDVNLTHGSVYSSSLGASNNGVLNVEKGVEFQFDWVNSAIFTSYSDLKSKVYTEYNMQYAGLKLLNPNRTNIDPYVYDLFMGIQLIELYGKLLEQYIWLEPGRNRYTGLPEMTPGRYDMCECQNMLKCPNGTTAVLGSSSLSDCTANQGEVLRRVSVIPSWYNETYPPELAGRLSNISDFWELGGADASLPGGEKSYPIGTITVQTFDVITITIDLSSISYNLTYGVHYQISVYVDCKPCPPQYKCDYTSAEPTCLYPDKALQQGRFDNCLKRYNLTSCMTKWGVPVDCSNSSVYAPATFSEPDLYKCNQLGYFCDNRYLPLQTWQIVKDKSGLAAPRAMQEQSVYATDAAWLQAENTLPYQTIKGCCACERYFLPRYFQNNIEDEGQKDNKHGFVQMSILALEQTALTVVVELLNGQYIQDFDANIPDKSDFFIHTPNRAKYTPGTPSRSAFMMLLVQSDLIEGGVELPLNLPMTKSRAPGKSLVDINTAGGTTVQMATKILIGRISNLFQGDPSYEERYTKHMRDLYITTQEEGKNVTSFTEFANVPDLWEISQKLYQDPELTVDVSYTDIWWSNYELSGQGFLGLPYLPFFSSCKGSDSYISWAKVTETDQSCQLVDYQNTVPVSPYPWAGAVYPNADICNTSTPLYLQDLLGGPGYNGAVFECQFEENIAVTLTNTRWFEAGANTVLFYFINTYVEPSDYEPSFTFDAYLNKTYSTYWGRGAAISNIVGTYQAIPVQVTTVTGSFGEQGVIPQQIELVVGYYQVDAFNKRLVTTSYSYSPTSKCVSLTSGGALQTSLLASGIPQCVLDSSGQVANPTYTLQIYFLPLPWLNLLNAFQFPLGIYLIFHFLTGFIGVGIAAFVWGVNRLLTKLRHPPVFHGFSLLYLLSQPSVVGVYLGVLPTFIAVLFLYNWFLSADFGGAICTADDTVPGDPRCFQDVVDWKEAMTPTTLRLGRQNLCILAVGVYVSIIFAILVMPEYSDEDRKTDAQRAALKNNAKLSKAQQAIQAAKAAMEATDQADELPPSQAFQPIKWRRATFLLLSAFVQFGLMIQMELSYANLFGSNVYTFIVGFIFLYLLIEVFILGEICPDKIQYAPMVASVSAISALTTMGAPSFTAFLYSYFVGFLFRIVQMVYMSPFISEIMSLWPRWQMMIKRRFRGNKRLTRDEKAKEELEWRKINEEIELEAEGIGPVLDTLADYSIDTTGLLISPPMYLCLQLFVDSSSIAPNYNILSNQIIYYILFSIIVIPFTFMGDVFLHNSNELVHGWKIFDYLSYQRYRFSVREYRWMLRNPVMDESISEEFQTVDLLCFSSQYYFLMGLLSFAMCQITFAIEAFLRLSYNPFGDPCFLIIFAIVFLIGEAMRRVYWFLADIQVKRLNWRGLWATKQIEGTIDDDVAAKLAVGEGRQADLEQERLELQALNSERFRHRFLERNRPWILQHLVELLTPRSLDQPGPDGRPTIEYVRDVYAELMAMGEGFRKPGEREDISSDEGDELEAARRNWPRDPLTGASLAIARMWLAKARKRRVFSKLVRGIIDQNRKTSCEICGRTPERNKAKLTAHLATNGEPDIGAIDRLITGFELLYGTSELEPQLWKAYFRATAEYCTRCNVCEDSMAQERLLQASREPGPSRISRPQDISSDEEGDLVDFEPVVVTRTSPEGRMMSKWLVAARKKLGGTFPRPDARKQMEKYAQKLRELKMKKARDMVGKEPIKNIDNDENEAAQITAATKALALRWIRMARDFLESKFRLRSESFREDLEALLAQMPEEDDWFFGAAMRLEGKDLLKRGSDLEDDRRTLEAEAAVKIHKINSDVDTHITERTEELERERRLFATKLAQQNDRISLDIENRRNELEKLKEARKKEFMAEERKAREELGAAPTEMIQDHRNQLLAIDELMVSEQTNTEKYRADEEKQARIMFDRSELIKRAEMERRKAIAGENAARIRQEVAVKVKVAETEWQGLTSKWLSIARRKVQVKKKEDDDARAGKRKRKGGK